MVQTGCVERKSISVSSWVRDGKGKILVIARRGLRKKQTLPLPEGKSRRGKSTCNLVQNRGKEEKPGSVARRRQQPRDLRKQEEKSERKERLTFQWRPGGEREPLAKSYLAAARGKKEKPLLSDSPIRGRART